ncbi:MAG: HAD family hydrolase [Dongiaceae bacterium]
MIAAVLFDLDETLLNRTDSLRAFLEDQYDRFATSLGDVRFETWRDLFLALDARGSVSKAVVYPAILSGFGGEDDAADMLLSDYREGFCRHARAFPGMNETLTSLRARGFKIGLVTNGETAFQTRSIEALGLHRMADAILISEREGLRKPERALFIRAADRLGVSPAACLFVGDNPVADILGAHAAGMRTAWFGRDAAWPTHLEPCGATIGDLRDVLGLLASPASAVPHASRIE